MQTEYQSIFERSEQKYLLQEAQYTALEQAMWPHMQPDSYGMTTIYSLYFDTPDYRLIRTSLEKPVYKEKLRLRCYGRPDSESTAFIELKKKYDDVVYKRRIEMPYEAAMQYLCGHLKLREMPQILQEVEWVRHFYGMLQPAMVLTYDRVAWFGRGRYIRPGAFSFSGGHGAGNRQYFPGYGSWSGHRNGIFGDGATLHFGNLCGADVADLLPVWQNQANGMGIERGHSENLDYTGLFDDIFQRYTSRYELIRVRTTNLGSLYKLKYQVTLKDPAQEKQMLDEIRCRNGNLDISCGRSSTGQDEL